MSLPPPTPPPMHPRWMSSRGPCAGCKHLRRKCQPDCIFAPYFPASDTENFSKVHRVFGASNAAKILFNVPVHLRQVTANSLVFEARVRCENLVFGTSQQITELNQQIQQLEHYIRDLKQKIRRQELLILQLLRQRGGFPNQQQHMQQQQPPPPPQYQTAMPFVSQPLVTVAIAPADVRPPTLRVVQPGGSRQQLEQNNSSGYHFAERINNSSGYLIDEPQSDPHPATKRRQVERNNSSGYASDQVAAKQLLLPPATVSRHQLEQNNSSGYHFAERKNNSSGYLIDKPQSGPHLATARQQLERNNSSGYVSDQVLLAPATVSRQQLEQNNSSEYFDKVVITQLSPHPATVQEPSSRQQVKRKNGLGYLVDVVNATFPESSSGQQLERKNS